MDVVLRCPPGRKYGITFSEPGDANLGQGTRVLVTSGVAEGDQRLCTGDFVTHVNGKTVECLSKSELEQCLLGSLLELKVNHAPNTVVLTRTRTRGQEPELWGIKLGQTAQRLLQVVSITPGCIAARAGLRNGEVIVRLNGIPVQQRGLRKEDFELDTVRLEILRDEAELASDLASDLADVKHFDDATVPASYRDGARATQPQTRVKALQEADPNSSSPITDTADVPTTPELDTTGVNSSVVSAKSPSLYAKDTEASLDAVLELRKTQRILLTECKKRLELEKENERLTVDARQAAQLRRDNAALLRALQSKEQHIEDLQDAWAPMSAVLVQHKARIAELENTIQDQAGTIERLRGSAPSTLAHRPGKWQHFEPREPDYSSIDEQEYQPSSVGETQTDVSDFRSAAVPYDRSQFGVQDRSRVSSRGNRSFLQNLQAQEEKLAIIRQVTAGLTAETRH